MRRAPHLIMIDTLSELHAHGQRVHGLFFAGDTSACL
jgi:hypothetical protein